MKRLSFYFLCCEQTTSFFFHFGLHCLLRFLDPFCLESLLCVWLATLARFTLLYFISHLFFSQARNNCTLLRRGAAAYLIILCILPPGIQTVQLVMYRKPLGMPTGLSGLYFCLLSSVLTTAAICFFEVLVSGITEAKLNTNGNGERKKQEAQVLFRRVIGYSRPDAPILTGAFVFLTLAVTCEMFIPYYTGQVVDILGSKCDKAAFYNSIFFMGLFSMGSSLSAGLRGGLFMCTLSRLNKRVRIMLFKSLIKQEIGFFESTKTGDITSRLSTDTTLMSQSVAMNVNIFLRSVIKTVGVLLLMVKLSWQLTLIAFIEAPLSGLVQKIYNTYYQRLSKQVQDSIARANETAGETISGIKTVYSFATEDSEAERYNSKLLDTHILKTKRDTVRATYLLVHRLIDLGVQVVMLLYGQQLIKTGQMTAGNLVSFILYQKNMGSYIRSLVHIYGNMLNSVGAAGKVFEYLDRKPEVSANGTIQLQKLRGHVQFKNVNFAYPSRPDVPVLKNVSLEVKQGEITALVGPSGGGKTTCVCLLERFYEPQRGMILLDGIPVQEYDHKYLHRKIALVGQEPVLFAGSIKDNILYGLQDNAPCKAEEAALRANAHVFISNLEQKYETDVGEGGSQLSGGQKQRLAIARALVRDPQVLVLDEATSCLDIESEHLIQEALSRIKGQTVLIIAHRLKTIENADKIIVIDGGMIVEQGTHQELMAKEDCYYKMVQRLFDESKTQIKH